MTPESKKAMPGEIRELLQSIPKVDEFLGRLEERGYDIGRQVKLSVREVLERCREEILAGRLTDPEGLAFANLAAQVEERLQRRMAANFRGLINGTGVVIHTNLGRSVLPDEAMAMIARVGGGYSNLEFDLETGRRGSRYSLVEDLLCELTGAEAGLVVNNNAAAVLLCLDTLAKGREVVVSRGRMIGFTSEVPLAEMVELAGRHGLPVMEDLGSGCLLDLSRFGLIKEPTVGEVIESGVDVVTFSGDKLLGGPQAGIILGRREIIDRIKANPMTRALRIDKFTLAGLEAVLRLYYDEETALARIPTLAMLSMGRDQIASKARRLVRRLKKNLNGECAVSIVDTGSRVGGGAMPEQDLPSKAVALRPESISVNELEERLRASEAPVIGRIEHDFFLLDMRTVADKEIVPLAGIILKAFGAV
ncbi:MAG: L-seryl-tRNA(Sec) selenium transferase [Desulfobulbaceae bacterium]|nr:L-seryl-tRNA(Sec) selenium transferase [Desulfobulbaceae bacterium]